MALGSSLEIDNRLIACSQWREMNSGHSVWRKRQAATPQPERGTRARDDAQKPQVRRARQ